MTLQIDCLLGTCFPGFSFGLHGFDIPVANLRFKDLIEKTQRYGFGNKKEYDYLSGGPTVL